MEKLKSPLFVYQTFRGSVSHLSPQNLELFELENLNLTFGHLYNIKEAIEKLNQDFTAKQYFNIKEETKVFVNPLEIGIYNIKGLSKLDAVKIQVQSSITEVTNQDYLSFLEKINPDYIVSLSEQPQNDLGKKSFKRNLDKSIQFLKQTIEKFPNKNVLVPLQLNIPEFFIEIFMEKLNQHNVFGIVLHDDKMEIQQLQKCINSLYKFIEPNSDLIIGIHGKGDPMQVLFGLLNKITLFNCSYPFEISNQGIALTFETQLTSSQIADITRQDSNWAELETKKAKQIDLNNIEHKREFDRIIKGCRCYTCENHTRAYIHHLLICKEMTANVLLTIHNLYTYQNFIKDIQLFQELKSSTSFVHWFIQTQTTHL